MDIINKKIRISNVLIKIIMRFAKNKVKVVVISIKMFDNNLCHCELKPDKLSKEGQKKERI